MQAFDPHMRPHEGLELEAALLCYVVFSCIIFEQNQKMYTFQLYKRTIKWIVD